VDKRLQNKNERAINKRNVDLIIAREEAKVKKRQMKDRTGNPKIDDPLEDFEKVYGYKFGSKFDEKIKAMKDGGDVPMPKRRPKKDQFRADKTESLDKEFSKKVAKQNEKNMKNVKKMKDGGLTGNQFKLDKNKNGRIDGDDFAKMAMGGEATQIKNKTKAQKQMDAYKKRTADSLAKTEKNRLMVKMGISSGFGSDLSEFTKKKKAERISNKMKKNIPVKKMEMGGKVEEYGGGGKVKGGKMTCRGMGAAVKGGGFSIS